MQTSPYNPTHVNTYGLGCSRFARRYSGNRENLLPERNGAYAPTFRTSSERDANASVQKESSNLLLSVPPGTEMFHFPGFALSYKSLKPTLEGFPHSDIAGSKVDWHLADTYRSHSTSFIAHVNQGIHHTPFHSHRECCTPLYDSSTNSVTRCDQT